MVFVEMTLVEVMAMLEKEISIVVVGTDVDSTSSVLSSKILIDVLNGLELGKSGSKVVVLMAIDVLSIDDVVVIDSASPVARAPFVSSAIKLVVCCPNIRHRGWK